MAAAVVRERDSVDTRRGGPLRVLERLDALHHELARPPLLDPGEVVVVDARIEHQVEKLLDRARPRVEGGEAERLGREEVDPPARTGERVDDAAEPERGRDRETVATVANPGARDGDVDGHEQGVEAGS